MADEPAQFAGIARPHRRSARLRRYARFSTDLGLLDGSSGPARAFARHSLDAPTAAQAGRMVGPMAQQAELVRQVLRGGPREESTSMRMQRMSVVGIARLSASFGQEGHNDAGEDQSDRPEVGRLIPTPPPHFITL